MRLPLLPKDSSPRRIKTLWIETQKRNRNATEFRNKVKSQLDKLKKGSDNDFKELVEFVESRLF